MQIVSPTIWAFDNIENKHSLYQGKECMKRFRSFLKEYATNIVDFEKKENATVNKKTAKITRKRKSMLDLRKKIYKKAC